MDGYSSDCCESNRLAVTNGFGLFYIALRVKYLPFPSPLLEGEGMFNIKLMLSDDW